MDEIMVPLSEVIDMISLDVTIEVPDREYINMTHLACYEAGLIDAGTSVRKALREALQDKYQPKDKETA
jgi:hypothetical protein